VGTIVSQYGNNFYLTRAQKVSLMAILKAKMNKNERLLQFKTHELLIKKQKSAYFGIKFANRIFFLYLCTLKGMRL
jgi:hypothetical protein